MRRIIDIKVKSLWKNIEKAGKLYCWMTCRGIIKCHCKLKENKKGSNIINQTNNRQKIVELNFIHSFTTEYLAATKYFEHHVLIDFPLLRFISEKYFYTSNTSEIGLHRYVEKYKERKDDTGFENLQKILKNNKAILVKLDKSLNLQ